jgi:hypothetical protein
MGYRGWHGVTDRNHVLLACSYEPVEGTLALRFNTGILMYFGVPENIYELLIKTPFALKEYNSRVRGLFPGVDVNGTPMPCNPDGPLPKKKLKRVQEVPDGDAKPQMSLFALLDLKKKRRGH